MAETTKPLFVTGAYIVVDVQGNARKNLSMGDTITADVTAECIKHLKSLGFVSETNPLDAK